MPGHDDTLNPGGPDSVESALDQLCTCGHTLGVHHTLDEACCEDGCECCAFQGVNPEFGNGQPSEAQLQAQLDAHNDRRASAIGESVRELTADLPGGEGRIGEIKGELDQILDAALLCDDSTCRHRRDRHKHDGCNDCDCPTFLEPKSTEPETLEVPAFLRQANRSNTREAQDDLWSHDAHARAIDKDHAAELEAMTDDQLAESNRVQLETLDNLCTCGHRYGDHAANYGELCLLAVCECVKFEALLKPADLEFVHDSPVDPEAIARATRTITLLPEDEQPFRITHCLKCGHEAEEHAANGTVCHVKGCDCEALVEYTAGESILGAEIDRELDHELIEELRDENEDLCKQLGLAGGYPNHGAADLDPKGLTFAHDENIGPAPEDIVDADGRKPYTPPLLRKKYIGGAELRKILGDAGRLPLLEELAEVDRVTINHDAEHWHEVERLARSPQGSSETNTARDRTIKAIAQSLLDLRQCLGVSIEHAQLLSVIERNTATIQKTVEALDRIVDRVTGEGFT